MQRNKGGAARFRVLLVDDDRQLAKAVARSLAAACEIIVAHSLAEARAALVDQRFDAVISDFDLGDGETVEELLEEIRQQHPHMRRILSSGTTGAHIDMLLQRQLALRVVPKPAEPRQLLAAIRGE